MFDKEGLHVELIDGKNGPELISGLIGGTTDLAVGAPGTVVPAIEQGQSLRPLSPYGSIDLAIAVTKDSGITTIEDLPGKRIAIPSRGGAAEQFVNQLLAERNIDGSTVQFIAAAPTASQIPLARKGDIDAAVLTAASQAVFDAQGIPMTAITEVDPVGSDGVSSYGLGTVLVTTATFAESDAAAPVCAALEAAAGWIADPANEQAGAQLLTERMNVPADKANQVWASQKTLWPVEISADRWTQNVAWVNNQTSGKSDADVPFDPLC